LFEQAEQKNFLGDLLYIVEPQPCGGQGHVLDLGLGTPCQQQESQEGDSSPSQ